MKGLELEDVSCQLGYPVDKILTINHKPIKILTNRINEIWEISPAHTHQAQCLVKVFSLLFPYQPYILCVFFHDHGYFGGAILVGCLVGVWEFKVERALLVF